MTNSMSRGLPDEIVSDRDSKFLSDFWREVCSIANVRLSFTTAYHKNANGQSERSNQTLIHALRCTIAGSFDQSMWNDLLPAILFALNTSVNASRRSLQSRRRTLQESSENSL